MRLLFLGDVVGRSGRQAVLSQLPKLRTRYKLDFVIVNGENSAGGFGITELIFLELLDAGADVVTLGNHAFDQKEALVFIERQPRLIRPINYPPGTPGRGSGIFKAANGADVLVINAMGLIFMPELADPFRAIDAEINACGLKQGADAIFIDFHAEATSEKQALGHFVDGRATCVVGTHTHAPTADERVLPGGTAYMSDAGMCGDYEFGARHDQGRADQSLPDEDPARPHGAGDGTCNSIGAGGGGRRRDGPRHPHNSIAARWCFDTYRAAVLGRVREFGKTAYSIFLSSWLRADTRGSLDCRPGQQSGIPRMLCIPRQTLGRVG